MAQKRIVPSQIRPFVSAYLVWLEKLGLPVQGAYVFGSWAKGTQKEWSDVDVCIVSSAFASWDQASKKLIQAASVPDLEIIEPHGFHPREFDPAVSALAREVVQHGIRVV